MTTFPKSKHDDQVDSTSQALRWMTVGRREHPILTYYKQELAKSRSITIAGVNDMLRSGQLNR